MKALQHHDYSLEKRHLDETCRELVNLLQDLVSNSTAGGDDWANYNLTRLNLKRANTFQTHRGSPYFLRVDILNETQKEEKIYIGYIGIPLATKAVTDWRAPIGSLISAKSGGQNIIISPSGPMNLFLMLKRRFVIEHSDLIEISDDIELSDSEGQKLRQEYLINSRSDDFLVDSLYSRGDTNLKDIVRTIQKEQDELIRYAPNATLVINGVAGSGKTSIAIHRISVLLFLYKNSISPSRTILFCPNRLFLEYIKDLLPSLGDNEVTQTTFDEWALGKIGIPGYLPIDSSIPIFTDNEIPIAIKRRLWQRALIKNNPKIKKLMENVIDKRKKEISLPNNGLTYLNFGPLGLHFHISFEKLSEIIHSSLNHNKPFNIAREIAIRNIVSFFQTQYSPLVWGKINAIRELQEIINDELLRESNSSKKNELMRKVEKIINEERELQRKAFYTKKFETLTNIDLEKQVSEDFVIIWPEIVNVIEEYYNFIYDGNKLREISTKLYTDEELSILVSSKPAKFQIEIEDIPAILYLKFLSDSVNTNTYDHIVIDEAQDFSLAQFDILRKFSKNDSFTIVGDIHQGINSHRGLSNWDQLKNIFPNSEKFIVKNILTCYRSTHEITTFTNRILRKSGIKKNQLPQPFRRRGKKVVTRNFRNDEMMCDYIRNEINRIKVKYKYKNIALITKNKTENIKFFSTLCSQEFSVDFSMNMIENQDQYNGGVAILPIHLAKGLEFEAVLLIGADNKNYSKEINYDGRLLYVGATRALHLLEILFVGIKSRYLD